MSPPAVRIFSVVTAPVVVILSVGSRPDGDRHHHRLGHLRPPRTSRRRSPSTVHTPFGAAIVTRGSYAGVTALHVSRHLAGHARLSNHVTHRANIWALKELGAEAVVGCTACGAVDPTVELGSLIVLRRSALPLQPAARWLPVHVLHRARRSSPRALDPARQPVLGRHQGGAAERRRRRRPRGAGRRDLRPRRRPALQHTGRDRAARRGRRDRGEPDGRAGDSAVR